MTHTLGCLAVTLVLPLVALAAQEVPVVQSGSRVRVTYDPFGTHFVRVVGMLESIDSTTIVVRDNEGLLSIPREGSTQLDVSAGPGACSGGGRGGCVAIGFFGGAALGVLAGLAAGGANTCGDCMNGLVFLFTVPAGAVVGTVIGAVVGGEHWRSVTPPARLSMEPNGARGLKLGLSLPL